MTVIANQDNGAGRRVNLLLAGGRVTQAFRDALFAAADKARMTPSDFAIAAAAEKLATDGYEISHASQSPNRKGTNMTFVTSKTPPRTTEVKPGVHVGMVPHQFDELVGPVEAPVIEEETRKVAALPVNDQPIADFETLADAGLDGPYVSPYQRISKSTAGPVLLATHWLDRLSARAYQGELAASGFLESMPFNQVLNRVLVILEKSRSDFYVTQCLHLLPKVRRSESRIPRHLLDESFEGVTRHELKGRKVVALGTIAAACCARHRISCTPTWHPSRRRLSYDEKAAEIAEAVRAAMQGEWG